MLEFSEKLTRTPWEMKEADVAGLRGHGLSDEQILAVTLVAAFFNIATRVADTLGIELDPQFTQGTPEYDAFLKSGAK
jgi:alkylhydroperoxidase family enzyme